MPRKPPHLRRAKSDENKRVMEYNKEDFIALRIPGSGTSKYFPGDILAFGPHQVRLELVRRTEKENEITFSKEEISDVKKLAAKLTKLLFPIQIMVICVAHFPKYRKWDVKQLVNWNGKDITVEL